MYYSEDEIDKLIQPIIDRQNEINTFVILKIAKRIKEIGELLPSDVFSLGQLAKTGADVRAINKKIAEITKLQIEDIKNVIRKVAGNVYENAKPFFDYRKKPFIPFEKNESVQHVVKAIEKQTSGTYQNMAKAQAFMVRDPHNPSILRPTPIARTYQNSVDKAIQTVQTGVQDYNSAMRSTLKELTDSGIKSVTYNTENGEVHTQRMDTAVRRDVLSAVREVSQGVQDEVGKQFGADGYEISVHACPAPDHCKIQGHQFTKSEYEKMAPVQSVQEDGSIDTSVYKNSQPVTDINGKMYSPVKRRIGTLNCRHFAFAIIIGQAPPNYTEKQLQDILDKNEKGYTFPNGKHYTMYECTQIQRNLETKIRRAKDGQMAAKAAGDTELAKKYQEKVTKYLQEYKNFSDSCGLRMKLDRIRVDGYKKI